MGFQKCDEFENCEDAAVNVPQVLKSSTRRHLHFFIVPTILLLSFIQLFSSNSMPFIPIPIITHHSYPIPPHVCYHSHTSSLIHHILSHYTTCIPIITHSSSLFHYIPYLSPSCHPISLISFIPICQTLHLHGSLCYPLMLNNSLSYRVTDTYSPIFWPT